MFALRTIMNRFYLLLGTSLYGFEVFGRENLPKSGPFVLSGHHRSPLDFFVVAFIQHHRPDLHIMVLDAGFEHPLTEWYSLKFNSLPVHKSPSKSNRKTLLEAAKILKDGKPLQVAVEGEMSWDGRVQPYKTGTAWIILHAQVPFVPVAYRGAYTIWPRWQALPKLSGKLKLEIGKPISLFDPFPAKVTSRSLLEANKKMKQEITRLEKSLRLKESV